jgi:hypothetical protein
MNERIRKIEDLAWGQVTRTNGLVRTDDFNQKFAELIVRECLMVCKKTEQYEVGNQDPDEVGCIRAGAVFCREDIKEHFGVEE